MTYVMTQQSEAHTSLQITVAREFAKNYRLIHLKTRNSRQNKNFSDETIAKQTAGKADHRGFS